MLWRLATGWQTGHRALYAQAPLGQVHPPEVTFDDVRARLFERGSSGRLDSARLACFRVKKGHANHDSRLSISPRGASC